MDKRDKIVWLVVLVLLVAFPAVGLSRYLQRVSSLIFIYMILALSLNIITGYMGQVSLGHAAFYAIGAYTSSLLSEHFGWNFLLTCLCAVLMTGFIGWLFSIPTMKLSGTYLAIITMGFGEIVKVLIINWESLTHGTYGVQRIARPEFFGVEMKTTNNGMYYLCLVFVVLTVLFCIAIERSKLGRTLRAIKDDPMAASLMGININKVISITFFIGGALAAVSGICYASAYPQVDVYMGSWLGNMSFVSAVLGGIGDIRGAMLGGFILGIAQIFATAINSTFGYAVGFIILIVILLVKPAGIMGRLVVEKV